MDTRIQGAIAIHGYKDTRSDSDTWKKGAIAIQGYKDTRIQGYKDTRIQGAIHGN
jgi:hypothetical protein